MAKKYIKKTKDKQKPGYRTADYFKGKTFSGQQRREKGFNPAQFKVQHKG